MRKLWILTLLSATALASAGEIKMTVGGTSGLKGSATVVNKIQKDGSKYVSLSMELRATSGQIVNVLQESVYDKTGHPVRKIQTTDTKGGTQQKIVAQFENGKVRVRATVDGDTKTTMVDIPLGKSINAKSEFWFVRDEVPAGGKNVYMRFDLQTLKWVEETSVYRGTRTISVGGKSFKAHLVEIGDVKAYSDENGDPLKLEMQGIVLERVVE